MAPTPPPSATGSPPCSISVASQGPRERDASAGADGVIGTRFDAALPRPERLRLFHLPAAGYDAVDFVALPPGALVCNCFGHESDTPHRRDLHCY